MNNFLKYEDYFTNQRNKETSLEKPKILKGSSKCDTKVNIKLNIMNPFKLTEIFTVGLLCLGQDTNKNSFEEIVLSADNANVEIQRIESGFYRSFLNLRKGIANLSVKINNNDSIIEYDPVNRKYFTDVEIPDGSSTEISFSFYFRESIQTSIMLYTTICNDLKLEKPLSFFITDKDGKENLFHEIEVKNGAFKAINIEPDLELRLYSMSGNCIFDYCRVNAVPKTVHFDSLRNKSYITFNTGLDSVNSKLVIDTYFKKMNSLIKSDITIKILENSFLDNQIYEIELCDEEGLCENLVFTKDLNQITLSIKPSKYTIKCNGSKGCTLQGALVNGKYSQAEISGNESRITLLNRNVFIPCNINLILVPPAKHKSSQLLLSSIVPCGIENERFDFALKSVDGKKTVMDNIFVTGNTLPAKFEGIPAGAYRLIQKKRHRFTMFNLVADNETTAILTDDATGECYGLVEFEEGKPTEVVAYSCNTIDFETTGQIYLKLSMAGNYKIDKQFTFVLVNSDGTVMKNDIAVRADNESIMLSPVVFGAYRLYEVNETGYLMVGCTVNEIRTNVMHDRTKGERYVNIYLNANSPIVDITVVNAKYGGY